MSKFNNLEAHRHLQDAITRWQTEGLDCVWFVHWAQSHAPSFTPGAWGQALDTLLPLMDNLHDAHQLIHIDGPFDLQSSLWPQRKTQYLTRWLMTIDDHHPHLCRWPAAAAVLNAAAHHDVLTRDVLCKWGLQSLIDAPNHQRQAWLDSCPSSLRFPIMAVVVHHYPLRLNCFQAIADDYAASPSAVPNLGTALVKAIHLPGAVDGYQRYIPRAFQATLKSLASQTLRTPTATNTMLVDHLADYLPPPTQRKLLKKCGSQSLPIMHSHETKRILLNNKKISSGAQHAPPRPSKKM